MSRLGDILSGGTEVEYSGKGVDMGAFAKAAGGQPTLAVQGCAAGGGGAYTMPVHKM